MLFAVEQFPELACRTQTLVAERRKAETASINNGPHEAPNRLRIPVYVLRVRPALRTWVHPFHRHQRDGSVQLLEKRHKLGLVAVLGLVGVVLLRRQRAAQDSVCAGVSPSFRYFSTWEQAVTSRPALPTCCMASRFVVEAVPAPAMALTSA